MEPPFTHSGVHAAWVGDDYEVGLPYSFDLYHIYLRRYIYRVDVCASLFCHPPQTLFAISSMHSDEMSPGALIPRCLQSLLAKSLRVNEHAPESLEDHCILFPHALRYCVPAFVLLVTLKSLPPGCGTKVTTAVVPSALPLFLLAISLSYDGE